MSTINVTGLQVIAVYCSDMERAKSFYIDKLGFSQGDEMSPGIMLNASDLTIYLEPGRESQKREMLKHPEISLCLSTESVKDAYEKLKDAGVAVVSDYVEFASTFAMFRVADPDGNTIEFAGAP